LPIALIIVNNNHKLTNHLTQWVTVNTASAHRQLASSFSDFFVLTLMLILTLTIAWFYWPCTYTVHITY